MIRSWLRDPFKRGRFGLGIVAALVLVLAAPFVLGSDARHLSAYADGKEDLSAFRAELPGRAQAILGTPSILLDVENPERSVYVAIGPERRYDEAEVFAIVDFLKRGGRVLLADETGFGDRIAYEAGFAFETDRLLDTNGYRGNEKFPVVDAKLSQDAGSSFKVVFNLPTKLTPLSNVGPHEVLARSSGAEYPNGSYVDKNGNLAIEREDEASPNGFPLIVRAPVGRGTLVLVADTGLFMNEQMLLPESQYRNGEYVKALVESLAGNGGTVYLDESRHAQPPLLSLYNDAVRNLGRATSAGIMPIILLLALAIGTYLFWYYTRETEDWSHHNFDVGQVLPSPSEVKPDLERLQRLARRRISERYNIPAEQVAAMPAEELQALTGDRTLAEAAAGTLRADPVPLFAKYSPIANSSSLEVQG